MQAVNESVCHQIDNKSALVQGHPRKRCVDMSHRALMMELAVRFCNRSREGLQAWSYGHRYLAITLVVHIQFAHSSSDNALLKLIEHDPVLFLAVHGCLGHGHNAQCTCVLNAHACSMHMRVVG
jgi:hypothetical protein